MNYQNNSVYKYFQVTMLNKPSVMSKLVTILLTFAYTILLFQYLKVTLTSRSMDTIELHYVNRPSKSVIKAMKLLKDENLKLIMMSGKKIERLPTDFKYILKWTEGFSHYRTANFKSGQDIFIKDECEYQNCYLTYQKTLLFDPINFDAILFNAESNWDRHPILRSVNQNYIFVGSESADNFPICKASFDDYYNLTFSYKLDSDIRYSYIAVYNHQDELIGPKTDMNWVDKMKPTSENVKRRLVHKRRAAAWFVSHCTAKSKREVVAKNIMAALKKYKLDVDTYGWCGKMSCSEEKLEDCLDNLEQDYYFYFSFENNFSEDYVTERLRYPLLHYTVPVVFGGANYSRFLSPGSYIDAKLLNATTVAHLMNQAIQNRDVYYNYFRWHRYYKYKNKPTSSDYCELCKALNVKRSHTWIKQFRKWWNPDFATICPRVKTNKTHKID